MTLQANIANQGPASPFFTELEQGVGGNVHDVLECDVVYSNMLTKASSYLQIIIYHIVGSLFLVLLYFSRLIYEPFLEKNVKYYTYCNSNERSNYQTVKMLLQKCNNVNM